VAGSSFAVLGGFYLNDYGLEVKYNPISMFNEFSYDERSSPILNEPKLAMQFTVKKLF
jgi:hypothetical protein